MRKLMAEDCMGRLFRAYEIDGEVLDADLEDLR
jgi:hypothetical protein